jgi:STE24 endopeptidase
MRSEPPEALRARVRAPSSWSRPADSRSLGRTWCAAAWLLAALGAAALLTHPAGLLPGSIDPVVPGAPSAGVGVLDVFDTAVMDEVRAYRGTRRMASLVLLAISVLVPLGILALLTPAGRTHLPRWSARLLDDSHPLGQPARVATLAVAVMLTVALVRLPVVAWVRLVHDGRFGMRSQTALSWVGDHLLAVATRTIGVALVAAGVSWLVRRSPARWPAQLTVAVSIAGLAVVLLHPVVVHPVLLPERPLPVGAHRDAILVVVERSGLDVPVTLGEASRRTPRRNAVATGLGPTRRIVLHDTVLDLAPAEVAALAAHELAHLEHRDLARGALAGAPVVLLAALAATRVLRRVGRRGGPDGTRSRDPSSRALVGLLAAALVAEVLMSPLLAAQTRRIESAADARAVVLTGEVEPWLVTLRAFTVDDLADPDPPRWAALLGSHPSSGRRIRAVLAVAEQAGIPVDVAQVLSLEAARPARR